jgi:hypothetical protein
MPDLPVRTLLSSPWRVVEPDHANTAGNNRRGVIA